MTRRLAAVCISFAVSCSACLAQAVDETPRNAPVARSARPLISRFVAPALGAPVCRASERQCQIGQYVTWCCRADQQCDYSYPGGCR